MLFIEVVEIFLMWKFPLSVKHGFRICSKDGVPLGFLSILTSFASSPNKIPSSFSIMIYFLICGNLALIFFNLV